MQNTGVTNSTKLVLQLLPFLIRVHVMQYMSQLSIQHVKWHPHFCRVLKRLTKKTRAYNSQAFIVFAFALAVSRINKVH